MNSLEGLGDLSHLGEAGPFLPMCYLTTVSTDLKWRSGRLLNKNGFRNHLKVLKCFRKRRFSNLSLTFPVEAELKDGSPVQLVLADNQDIEPQRRLDRVIIEQ